MKILSAEYVKSFTTIQDFDLGQMPSFAFIGRSNVGKSSLINHLVQRKKLVKTSATPGKTQLINYFVVNGDFYVVDLPGYGFASVPEKVKQAWKGMIQEFLFQAPALKLVVQVVDVRHSPSAEDREFARLLKTASLPHLVIANKLDKLPKTHLPKAIKEIKKALDYNGPVLGHSALEKLGRDEIWAALLASLGPVAPANP